MKTVIEINNNNYGSTGNIMFNISNTLEKNGYNVFCCSKNSKAGRKINHSKQIFVGIWLERVISERIAYYTGYKDCFNLLGTKLFINRIAKEKPDLIHLHNIHGSFINIKMLFNYINKNNIPVVWTLHDAWSFTGQCTYFDMVCCNKWKTGCENCPKLNEYPASFIDKTKKLWKMKKNLFESVNSLTIVTPSNWLSALVKESFLRSKQTIVINNGINLEEYKPLSSDFKNQYNINNKHVVLGVAYDWSERKGLETFIKLSKELPDNYQIVLVGTNDEIDKIIPSNIISIHKTNSKEELIKIYSIANVFVNPTKEENFPTVNIEALACGTPIITYDTGGSKEMIDDTCGIAVAKNDYDTLKNKIIDTCENNTFTSEDCIIKSKNYNMNDKFNEYYKLIKKLIG